MKKIKLEICVGNIDDIEKIKDLNIDRIELNSALELGGLSSSINTLKEAKKLTNIPILCMVRIRKSGFIYSDKEIEIMLKDAKDFIDNGADGIVCGFLNEDLTINKDALIKLRSITKDKELVFHKAFDYIKDQNKAIKELIDIGVDRILLMGNNSFEENLNNIKHLNEQYGSKIEFLPGGGITLDNLDKVINITNTKQIHGTFKEYKIDLSTNEAYISVSKEILLEVLNKIKTED